MNRLGKDSELIAGAYYDWLKAETESSKTDRNKFLNNFDEMRRRVTLGYDDEDNWATQKEKSHLGRLPMLLFPAFREQPQGTKDDLTTESPTANIILAPLMLMSGDYRLESLVSSSSPREYLAKRSKATGIDIEAKVYSELKFSAPYAEYKTSPLSMMELERWMQIAVLIGERAWKSASAELKNSKDLEKSTPEVVPLMKEAQFNWAGFATKSIILAAKLRDGDLSGVPFPEPISISDQTRVTYPLAT